MSDAEINAGNVTHCQYTSVLKQALLCENRSKGTLSKDNVQEMIIQKECWDVALPGKIVPGYIQCLGVYPFYVTFYLEGQIQMYVESCSNNGTSPTILHFYTTGSVMKKMKNQKQPYYYTQLLESTNIPICEFLSTRHTSYKICKILESFLAHANAVRKGKAHRPCAIITDFSYALINAVIWVFNKLSLLNYLREIHTILTTNAIPIACLTVLTILCCAHIVKFLYRCPSTYVRSTIDIVPPVI